MQLGESIPQRNERVFGVSNPVAFITGSVSRVGYRVAQHLLSQGFRLVLHSHHDSERARTVLRDLQQAGHDCVLVHGGVEHEGTVTTWREQIEVQFQRLDVLVNSAAIWDPKPLETTTADDFKRFFEVNTLGSLLTCQHFGLWMAAQPSGGAIVNIGDWAVRRPYRQFAAYFPSKGAIETLTQSMAVELATRNPRVRVNAVLPGPVMLAENVDASTRAQIVSESLLQREGTADDVAWAILFLITSPFVTGICLPVDGGRTIYAGPSADPVAHANATGG